MIYVVFMLDLAKNSHYTKIQITRQIAYRIISKSEFVKKITAKIL